jgi:hypothetical protein
MRTQLLSVCLSLCAAQMVQAQQWPGYAPVASPMNYPSNTAPVPGSSVPFVSPVPGNIGGKGSVDAASVATAEVGGQPAPAGTQFVMPGMPLTIDEDALEKAGRRDDEEPNYFYRKTNERWWANAGYMMSWFKAEHPSGPLVTTGSTLDAHPGAVGQPGTVSLFGQNDTNYGMFSGVRAEIGFFLDDTDMYSIEINGFYLNPNHVRASGSSDAGGNPFLSRPAFNVATMAETAYIDAAPGLAVGGYNVDSRSQLFGSEINERMHLYGAKHIHLDSLFGFRYAHLQESLTLQDQFSPLAGGTFTYNGNFLNPGDVVGDQDRFQTTNDFYGFQVGARVTWEHEWFSVSAFFKFALGINNENVNINGSSTLTSGGAMQVLPGGILALPTNINSSNRTLFGYVPETGFTASIHATKHIEFSATYAFLYWNEVARPQEQIDRAVSPTLVPTDVAYNPAATTTLRPTLNFLTEPFWMNSVTVGVTLHY